VELTADKQATAERLRAAGVSAPAGVRWRSGERIPVWCSWPCVAKPVDGAGSRGVQLLDGAAGLERLGAEAVWRLEPYCPGLPASISILCGPRSAVPLPPSRQILSTDGAFRYLGGETPLAEPWFTRAVQLGRAAMAALPPALGYVGIDLVLGNLADGSDDHVIEVNPRLTTSYLGLRRVLAANLAGLMFRVACGECPDITYDGRSVTFLVDEITRVSPP
jgi:predicted ATP-grasp superfamily ATP-dependent carboligase